MKKIVLLLLAAFATVSFANHTPEHKGEHHDGPCKKIVEACEAAGFKKGEAESGKGLFKNCVHPIMEGTTVAGVTVSAEDVTACKAKKEQHKEHKKH